MNGIYIFCASFGFIILLAQIILGVFSVESAHHEFGGHSFGHGHDSTHHDHQNGRSTLNLRSVRGLAAGCMMFGFTGGFVLSQGANVWVSILLALVVGFLANLLTAWAFVEFGKMESNGATNFSEAVGKTARVYSTITKFSSDNLPNGLNGSIQIALNNGLTVMPAWCREGNEIQAGDYVRVTNVEGNIAEVVIA